MKTGKLILTISAVLFVLCALLPLTACESLPPLDSPTEFVVDDNYNITWMSVDYARGYELNITNNVTGASQNATARRAAISLAYLEEGDYDIQIKAKGDGKKYSDSKWSNAIYFQKSDEAGCIYKLIGNGSEYQLSSVSPTLESIVLQDSYRGKPVTQIGEGAFRRASKIEEVVVGKYVVEIGSMAFFNCGYLTKIELPDTIETIGEAAFQACKLLTEFTFPSKVKTASKSMFAYCRELTTINFNNVAAIDELAFSGCSALTSLELSDKIITVGKGAFRDCTALETVKLGGNLKYVAIQAFSDCSSLSKVIFSDSGNFKQIGDNAFRNCTALTSVTLNDGVEYVGNYAFYGCSQLAKINIPDSVTTVGYAAFKETKIYNNAKEADEMFVYIDKWLVDVLYSDTKPINILTADGKTPSTEEENVYEIQSGIVGIADSLFRNCKTLTEVTVPKSILYIGNYTFANCSTLWRFNSQGTSLKIIGVGAFSNDTKLSSVLIANSRPANDKLEVIEDYAFYGCTSLNFGTGSTAMRFIPASVKRIGMYAFKNAGFYKNPDEYGVIYADDWVVGCMGQYTATKDGWVAPGQEYQVNDITLKEGTRGIADYAFSYCFSLTNLSNTQSARYLGIGSFYCCTQLSNYSFNSDITEIPDFAFYECQSLMLSGLPRRLTSIGRSAFYDCKQVSSIELPANVQKIGTFAFYSCSNLKDVTLNEVITEINPYTFYKCSKLEGIIIPSNVKAIGASAFSGCTNLKNVEFEEGVETIGAFAFKENLGLTQVKFADSIKTIDKYAFYNCLNITDIDFANVETISDYAFANTSHLKSIVLPATLKNVGTAAFLYSGENAVLIKKGEIIEVTKTDEEGSEYKDTEVILPVYSGMESIIISGDVTKINEHAFYGFYFATFYFECQNKNDVWGRGWNSSYRPVVWGVTLSEDKSYVVSINVTKDTFIYQEALNAKFAPARKGYKCVGWTTKFGSNEVEYTVENVYTAPVGSVVYAIYVEDTQSQE